MFSRSYDIRNGQIINPPRRVLDQIELAGGINLVRRWLEDLRGKPGSEGVVSFCVYEGRGLAGLRRSAVTAEGNSSRAGKESQNVLGRGYGSHEMCNRSKIHPVLPPLYRVCCPMLDSFGRRKSSSSSSRPVKRQSNARGG